MNEVFKDILVVLLQKNNISAYKLSADTGISEGLISDWKKKGKVPASGNLIKIADYFDVSIDYLVGRTDKPEVNR